MDIGAWFSDVIFNFFVVDVVENWYSICDSKESEPKPRAPIVRGDGVQIVTGASRILMRNLENGPE